MVLALIANISLSAIVLATIITMLARGISRPVTREALVTTSAPERSRTDRGTGRVPAARRMDAGLTM